MKLLLSFVSIAIQGLLFAICIVFSLSVQADTSHAGVTVLQLAKASTQWDGKPLPAYPTQNPEITILSYEIAPGVRLPMHQHPVINAGVVMQGRLTVIAKDGGELILNPGDSIIELVNQWHYGVNRGDEAVKLMMFYAGQVGVPLVIKE